MKLHLVGKVIINSIDGEITMKKSLLLGAVSALSLLTMIISANAAVIASDNTSIIWAGQSHDPMFTASPLSTSDSALTSDIFGDSGQTQTNGNFNHFIDGALLANLNANSKIKPQTNSRMDIWLFLIVAAVIGVLSEIFHRRSQNR